VPLLFVVVRRWFPGRRPGAATGGTTAQAQ